MRRQLVVAAVSVTMLLATTMAPVAQRGAGRVGAPPARPSAQPQRGRGNRTADRMEVREYTFAPTGEQLPYAVYVSKKVDRSKPAPLMITLHGLGSEPAQFLGRYTDQIEKAGYIAAAPRGYIVAGWYGSNGPNGGGSAGGRHGDGQAHAGEWSEQDVMNVLAIMQKDFKIDPRRIYLFGHSMGGAGALYLGPKYKDIWAAVAASAPAVQDNHRTPKDLEAAPELPFILMQGDDDRLVPVEQSRRWAQKMKALNMTYEYHELKGVGHGIPSTELADIFKFFNKHPRVDR